MIEIVTRYAESLYPFRLVIIVMRYVICVALAHFRVALLYFLLSLAFVSCFRVRLEEGRHNSKFLYI